MLFFLMMYSVSPVIDMCTVFGLPVLQSYFLGDS